MATYAGYNFRATPSLVTDGAGETVITDYSGEFWGQAVGIEDNGTGDPHTAGDVRCPNTSSVFHDFPLPNGPGTYDVTLAAGQSYESYGQVVKVLETDGVTERITLTAGYSATGGFYDATGTRFADRPSYAAGAQPRRVTFTGSSARLLLGAAGASGYNGQTRVCHVGFRAVIATLVAGTLALGATGGTSQALTWGAASGGITNSSGAPYTYDVQYRVTGQSAWVTAGAGISGLAYIVAGLSTSTAYDFQIVAHDSTSSTTSNLVSATTLAPTVTGITVTPTSPVSLSVGGSVQLTPVVQGQYGPSQGVSYVSGDTSIATVSSGGNVVAIKAGSVVITIASTANPSVSTTFGVVVLPTNVTVNPSDLALALAPVIAAQVNTLVPAAVQSAIERAGGYLDQIATVINALNDASIDRATLRQDVNTGATGASVELANDAVAAVAQANGTAVATAVRTNLAPELGRIDAPVSSRSSLNTSQVQSAAQAGAEAAGGKLDNVFAALTQPLTELGTAPPASGYTAVQALQLALAILRNPTATTNGQHTVFKTDGVTPLLTATLTDDGTTLRKAS